MQDAWRMLPWADVLYACDLKWWRHHDGTTFTGEKWSTHHAEVRKGEGSTNDKTEAHEKWGVRCVSGVDEPGFSEDPSVIHYGNNSGFQAINLAILFGCVHITLIGFDMRRVQGKSHFFGEHPKEVAAQPNYEGWVPKFAEAREMLPDEIRIVNATPGSALGCFPLLTYDEAMHERKLYDPDHPGLPHWEIDPVPGAVQGAATSLARDGAAGHARGGR